MKIYVRDVLPVLICEGEIVVIYKILLVLRTRFAFFFRGKASIKNI